MNTLHLILLVFALLLAGSNCALGAGIAAEIAAAESAFAGKLAQLAATAPADEAAILQAWCRPVPTVGERLYVAADAYSLVEPAARRSIRWPVTSPTAVLGEATKLRQSFATQLSKLAREAAAAGEASLAMQCAHRAVREDPANAAARSMLGYELVGEDWLTPYAAKMARTGRVWNAKFGWIKNEDLPRLERGQAFSGGRWITGKADAERHSKIDQGWQVRTDHFAVTTNLKLEAAAQLAAELEELHKVWWQLFADVLVDKTALRQLAERGRGLPIPRRPMQVIYHKDRQQYNDRLRARQPQIEATEGIYFDRYREAHFFAGTENTSATLYHEAVHQLFFETLDSVRSPGELSNFWAIEAAALPFESLTREDDPLAGPSYLLGLPPAGRLVAARYRYTATNFRPPLADIIPLGQRELQSRGELPALYSQLAGWGHYFVASGDRVRRRQFATYLRDVYTGDARPGSFSEQLDQALGDIDSAYGKWIESLPAPE